MSAWLVLGCPAAAVGGHDPFAPIERCIVSALIPNAPVPHAVTLVAQALPNAAIERAKACIQNHGGQVAGDAWLSPGRAIDLETSLRSDRAAALTEALWEALPGVDLAVMPARNRRKRLMCADMDSTIVVGETIEFMAEVLGVRDKVADITERAMRGELDFTQALVERVRMLRDLPVERLADIAASLQYHRGGRRLVATMQTEAQAHCVLVSGGFEPIADVVRVHHGFNRQVSNVLGTTGDGRLSGTVHLPVVDGDKKLEIFRSAMAERKIPANATLAIGDGANDLPMIQAASLGIAYKAKPLVRKATRFQINHTDLVTALYFQGYADAEIAEVDWS